MREVGRLVEGKLDHRRSEPYALGDSRGRGQGNDGIGDHHAPSHRLGDPEAVESLLLQGVGLIDEGPRRGRRLAGTDESSEAHAAGSPVGDSTIQASRGSDAASDSIPTALAHLSLQNLSVGLLRTRIHEVDSRTLFSAAPAFS